MRRFRERQKAGIFFVHLELGPEDTRDLVDAGFLAEGQRRDRLSIEEAAARCLGVALAKGAGK
jgi:hypothetical protein